VPSRGLFVLDERNDPEVSSMEDTKCESAVSTDRGDSQSLSRQRLN